MMKPRNWIASLLAAMMIGLPAWGEPVTIFAASSLKTALDEVIETKNIDAIAVYGGSAAIARQIAQGVEADIVILAHADWMDWLTEQELLAPETRCDLLGNRLVLAGPADAEDFIPESGAGLIDSLKGARLAVGQLETVPAGQYAAAYLQGQGWLDALRPHLAQTSNVRLALALIARAETPLGFVYASDVAAQPRVRAVFTPEQGTYPAIRYPMALTVSARGGAQNVWDILSEAGEVFKASGFSKLGHDDPDRCNPS